MVEVNQQQGVAQLSYESAVYREQLRLLQNEIKRIDFAMVDLSKAVQTAERIKNDDVLVPVGGGSFVKATVYSTKLLVPVGADYLVEMEKDEAVGEINKRIEATKKAIEKLNTEFQKVSSKLQEVNGILNNLQNQVAINKQVDENIGEDYI